MNSTERNFFGKIEDPLGTAETLAAADAKVIMLDSDIKFEPETIDMGQSPYSQSPVGKAIGAVPGNAKFSHNMCGSGVLSTAPEWIKYLLGCGMVQSTLKKITIGAVTTGPFVHGETVTGGTSLATGRVVVDTATGTTTLYLVVLSGTFQSGDVLTGSVSGATATTSSVATDAGLEYHFTSDEALFAALTMASDKISSATKVIRKIMRSARGNAQFTIAAGKPGKWSYDYRGVKESVTEENIMTGIAFETNIAPILQNASFLFGTYAGQLVDISIDFGNKVTPDEDANAGSGIKTFTFIREPKIDMTLRLVPLSTFNFDLNWFAATKNKLDFILGSTEGHKFRFYGPKLQIDNKDEEDKDGFQFAKLSCTPTAQLGLPNSELSILVL